MSQNLIVYSMAFDAERPARVRRAERAQLVAEAAVLAGPRSGLLAVGPRLGAALRGRWRSLGGRQAGEVRSATAPAGGRLDGVSAGAA